ncbi:hypothetical protein TNCV_1689121 [Trichonephila clavipes]|nr:hypothetical protein TNCV_1689121 [Trichonephila clavipes]
MYFADQFLDTLQPEPQIHANEINIVVSYQKCKTLMIIYKSLGRKTINEGQKPLSKEEEYCKNHYQMTRMHIEAGRYVVQIPVKGIQSLGHSKRFSNEETKSSLEKII